MILVCEEVCGDGTGIVDMKCCWCQRTVHNKCQQQLSDLCDLGEFKRFLNFFPHEFKNGQNHRSHEQNHTYCRFVIPPHCVKTNTHRSIMRRYSAKTVISRIETSGTNMLYLVSYIVMRINCTELYDNKGIIVTFRVG